MTEPVFFSPPAPLTVAELAALFGGKLRAGDDAARPVAGIGALDSAGSGDLTYFDSRRHTDALAATRAAACFCTERDAGLVPATTAALIVAEPQRAFALAAGRLYPEALRPPPASGVAGVSPAAHVHPAARIEAGTTVEAGAVIGPGAEIGRGSLIGPGVTVGPGVRIGRDCWVGPGASVLHALIGDRVAIFPGARIGQDGFGFVPGAGGHTKIPQVGRVIVQDSVEIGANTTIDRGGLRDTVIGEGTKIDNLVQIAHNVVIGRHCLIAGKVGISGSVTIGDFVMLGGNAGIRDNVSIGTGARVAAASGVHSDIPAGETWGGLPAMRSDRWRRQLRAMSRLAKPATGEKEESDGG